MKDPKNLSKIGKLTEGGIMVALAFALSLIPHFELPFGGSISWFATLPILVMSLRHNWRWGLGTAAVYSLAQMLQGMGSITLLKTIPAMILCAFLDYIFAYLCLGFCGPIARRFKNETAGIAAGILATGAMRLVFSILSGVILWGEYAGDTPVWQYSVTYNASWCIPDVLIVLIAALILSRVPQMHLTDTQQTNAGAQ